MGEVDRILGNVYLVFERRLDVDGRIGDHESAIVERGLHDEDMADAARSAQPSLPLQNELHHGVGVQTALHQRLSVGGAAELGAARCRLFLGIHIDNVFCTNIDADLVGDSANLAPGPYIFGQDEPGSGGFDSAEQGNVAARPADCDGNRLPGLPLADQRREEIERGWTQTIDV
jgi:hypothetical protein